MASAPPHGPPLPAVCSRERWNNFPPLQCTPSVLLTAIFIQYNDGIPKGSRFDSNSEFFKDTVKKLQEPEGQEKLRKVRELTKLAEEGRSLPISHRFHVKLKPRPGGSHRTQHDRERPRTRLGCKEPQHLYRHSRRVES